MAPTRILFVCAGNICRSPLAEGVFRHLTLNAGRADAFEIDSAGTGSWHQGDKPDRRSIAVASAHGFDISKQRARQITRSDFTRCDLILAMDHDNLRNLRATAPTSATAGIHLFSAFTVATEEDIPDPYYGGREGFETVYSMLFKGCCALLAGKACAS